jgi:transcriptional regulator with XRE-family HTH domain
MSRILDDGKLYANVGHRIRLARRSCTPLVRQEDVAEQSRGQLSRSSIANIEAGRQSVTLHQLYRIAEILNVEPSVLLPERNLVFEGPEEKVEDPAKREWLSKVVAEEPESKKKKR